jgi:hypothetical protein
MFTVTAGRKRILMTGDTAGWILNEALGSAASPPKWDIIKVLHHGSSNNNILKDANTTLVDGVVQFFTTFQADKYVISSDTWNRVPNPDLVGRISLSDSRGSADPSMQGRSQGHGKGILPRWTQKEHIPH